MCGRFSLITISEFLSNRFNVTIEEELVPRYNIAPSQNIPIITNVNPGKLIMARWGLVPHWAKDKSVGYSMINARAETLLEKSSYKMPFQRQRCLIPADGFYEWKKTDTKKVPYRITLKDQKVFAFAGIYDIWKTEEEELLSCSIITTTPNRLVAQIHDRMPAILRQEHERLWLAETPVARLSEVALVPYPPEQMKSEQISELINSPKNDSVEVIKPVKSLLDF